MGNKRNRRDTTFNKSNDCNKRTKPQHARNLSTQPIRKMSGFVRGKQTDSRNNKTDRELHKKKIEERPLVPWQKRLLNEHCIANNWMHPSPKEKEKDDKNDKNKKNLPKFDLAFREYSRALFSLVYFR